MVHGIGVGGGALLGLAAALFYLYATRPAPPGTTTERESRAFAAATGFTALLLWLAVVAGTYVIFPPYRATSPPGAIGICRSAASAVFVSRGSITTR